MLIRSLVVLLLLPVAFPVASSPVARSAAAQGFDTAAWATPTEPFTIVGPIHYVGTAELAAYLVTTPAGHILIDGALEASGPAIEKSIRALGFKPEEIRVLLTTQAHFDHVASMAYLQRLSGGRVEVMQGDEELLASGGSKDYLAHVWGKTAQFPPVRASRVLKDGDTVSLGGITLIARATPGHTPGCTTWLTTVTEGGRSYAVVFTGSTTVNPGTQLAGRESYPGIARDFARSFEVLASLKPDIFLAAHAGVFNMEAKRAQLKKGGTAAGVNPFVDPEGFRAHVAAKKREFEQILALQRNAARGK